MARNESVKSGVLSRLARNEAGNTIAIMAAALIPFCGVIGSGIDISRAYLMKTRLQQACDTGVIAGRKMMGTTGTITAGITQEVRNYVNFNFPQGQLDTSAFTITPTLGANDEINLTLATSVPTVMMKIFGKMTMPVSVSCSARNDYSNIDIVLVLDTTGSMSCAPERTDSQCMTWISSNGFTEEVVSGVNVSRMQALRTALASLKTQMATIEAQFALATPGTEKRVRYAIVPFSQMVNPGMSLNSSGTTLYSRQSSWFNPTMSHPRITTCTGSGRSRTCTTRYSTTHNASWISSTWDGCVEERATINTITPSNKYIMTGPSANLPSGAHDLMIDEAATNDATRWTMADNSLMTGSYACPKAMRELQEMTSTNFNNYFSAASGFIPDGRTYLDIGLLWAARLLSRTGLWSADNPTIYHGWPVERYVIFMTDGVMQTESSAYAAYSKESTQMRTTVDGATGTSDNNHTARWGMICDAIKNMNTKIFAISFSAGSPLSTDMQNCSSGSGYAFKADNATQLTQAFKDIGNAIGSLRLSQ